MKGEEAYPPLTWSTLWRAWLVSVVAWVLTDGTWAIAGGDWLAVPFWLEFLNAFVLNAGYWTWRREREREQAVSEEEPG